MISDILLKSGLVGSDILRRAVAEKKEEEFLYETLVRLGEATEKEIAVALKNRLKIEFADLSEMRINRAVARLLPLELCERNRILPIRLDGRQLTLAMADPSDIFKCDNISLVTGFKVIPAAACPSDILLQIEKLRSEQALDSDISGGLDEIEPLDEIDIVIDDEDRDVNLQDLIGSSEVPPVVRIVNAIISEAIRYKASDIHIEPKNKYTVVRYRIDGMLYGKMKIPPELHSPTISRIKILAKMDISERRKPQDGRITVKTGARMVDLRVSTMPTINGEKTVMRILDRNASVKRLDELGVGSEDLGKLMLLTKKPQGIIISTGPTGSGKTTFLYSIMNEMLQSTRNFETIEDPVEYFLEDASQIYIRDKVGLTFASVLRATLRQDPDVILVGEIRDFETADVAFKSALTGHMVLTSLHTNNAVASITRLLDMGIKPYLIASALEGIIAQRLVRTNCPYCKREVELDHGLVGILKISPDLLGNTAYAGAGCDKCNNTGYLGRTGIFEIFIMNEDFRQLISSAYKESELSNMARAGGMKSLLDDAMEKLSSGATTIEEIIRVVGPQSRHERTCETCGTVIDAKFIFCPYCGAYRQNLCISCRMPLETDWNNCPFCGLMKDKS